MFAYEIGVYGLGNRIDEVGNRDARSRFEKNQEVGVRDSRLGIKERRVGVGDWRLGFRVYG